MTEVTALDVSRALRGAGLQEVGEVAAGKLAAYSNLLLRWNRVTNLTGIRNMSGVLSRHIVESVAAVQLIPVDTTTLLDYGSGAGLPGIPIAVCRSTIAVTLAEAQGKKAAFLREVVRSLDLDARVFGGRAETLAPGTCFDIVTMRAVEKMPTAVVHARTLVRAGGAMVVFTTKGTEDTLLSAAGGEVISRSGLTAGEILLVRV